MFRICLAVAILTQSLLQAETVASPDVWKHKGNLGISGNSGNADAFRVTAGWSSLLETEGWNYTVEANALYGEDEGVVASERFDVRFQADHKFDERSYLGISSNFLYDDLADIDYRFGNFLVYGYRLIDNDAIKLRVEFGPGFILEDRNGVQNGHLAYRFGQFFNWRFSKKTKFFQSLAITGPADDTSDYILEATAGIESQLEGPWSFRLAARAIKYGEDTGQNGADDFILTAGLGYAFQLENEELPTIQDAQKAKDPRLNEWVTTALLGGSFATGNTEAASFSAGFLSRYETSNTETSVGVTANYAEANSQTTAQTLFVEAHTQRNLNEFLFNGVRLDGDHNEIADLKYRIYSAPYIGYRILTLDDLKTTLELGPSLVVEDEGGEKQTYLGFYANLKNRWQIAENTRLTADFAWLADTGELSDNVLTSTIGFDHSLTNTTKLKLVLTHFYDNSPAPNREKTDLSLVFGVEFEL